MPQPFPNIVEGFMGGFQSGFNMARVKAQDKMQKDMFNLKVSLDAMSNTNLPDKTKLEIYNTMYVDSMSRLAPDLKIPTLNEWQKQESFYKRGQNLSNDKTLTLNDTIKGLIGLQEEATEAGSKIDFGERIEGLQDKQKQIKVETVRKPVANEAVAKGRTTQAEADLFTQTGKVAPKEFQPAMEIAISSLKNIATPESILDYISTRTIDSLKAIDIEGKSKDKSIEWFMNEVGEFKKKKASIVAGQDILSSVFDKESNEKSIALIDKQIQRLESFADQRFGSEWKKFMGDVDPLNLF